MRGIKLEVRGQHLLTTWPPKPYNALHSTYPFIIEPTYMPPSPPLLLWPTMLIPRKFTVSEIKKIKKHVSMRLLNM